MSVLQPQSIAAAADPESAPPIHELVRHEPWLRRLAHQLIRDPHTAEDLLQETWIAAMKRPPIHAPKAWLKRVLYNRARSHWHSESLRGDSEFRAVRDDTDESHVVALSREELRHCLASAVMELPEPYRSSMLDHYLRETPTSLMARRAQLPESTIRWRLMRGREQLRGKLDQHFEGDRHAWLSGLVGGFGWPETRRIGFGSALSWTGLGLLGVSCLLIVAAIGGWRGIGLTGIHSNPAPELQAQADSPLAQQPTSLDQIEGNALELEAVDKPAMSEPSLDQRSPIDAALPFEAAGTASEEHSQVQESVPLLVRVFDKENRAPLADAQVFVLEREGWEEQARTNNAGEATVHFTDDDFHGGGFQRLTNLASVRILPKDRPWSTIHSVSKPLLVKLRHDGSLELPSDREHSTVRGVVRDQSGAAVVGALVQLGAANSLPQFSPYEGFFTTLGPLETRTDEAGHFEFLGVWPRPMELRIQSPGFVDEVILCKADEEWEIDVEVALRLGAELRGVVRDNHGHPVPGARVWFDPPEFLSPLFKQAAPGYVPRLLGYSSSVLADEEGRYELRGLPSGELRLWAQDPDDPSRVAQELITTSGANESSWSPSLVARDPLRIHVKLGEVTLPEPAFIHLCSAKRRYASWQRLLAVPESGWVELYDWPDILMDVYVQNQFLAEAPVGSLRQFTPTQSPFSVEVVAPQKSKLQGTVSDHRGERNVTAHLSLVDRSKDLMASARILEKHGSFELAMEVGSYHAHLEVEGRGLLPLEVREMRAGADQEWDIQLPEGVKLIPLNASEHAGRDLEYEVHAHLAIGTKWDQRVLIEKGVGVPSEAIDVLPGFYSYLIRRQGQIIGGALIPIPEGSEGRFDVRLGADPIVPIGVQVLDGPAPVGTRLNLFSDQDPDFLLELGDEERNGLGDWYVALRRGDYHVEALLPDGSTLLQAIEVQDFGVIEHILLREE